MIDLILTGIIIALIVGFGWHMRESAKAQNKLINALLSKTPQDLTNLTLADHTTIKPEVTKADPDLVPTDQMTDDEFMDHIHAQNLNDVGEDQEVV